MLFITEASSKALEGLRDLTTLEWYLIPLLAIILYIYTVEANKAQKSENWEPIFAGLTIFGMDFINETWNGIYFAVTQDSAFWTTPGPTAFRVTVGWNIEIIFWFLIAGIIYYYMLPIDKDAKILGLPNRWVMAVIFAVLCVIVECILNLGNILVWEYPWWNLSITGVWLIFLIGYFPFTAAANIVMSLNGNKKKFMAIGLIYSIAIVLNIIFGGILGLVY